MNTVNNPKPSNKIPLLIILGVVLIGIPLTIITLQQQQIFQQFAWATRQSATAACSPENGGAIVTVQFTNTEDAKSMDVKAKDIQSGKTVDLGTIKPKETKNGIIKTESKELAKGAVQFTLTWTDGSSGKDTRSATYEAVEECADAPPICPANPEINEGKCTWDAIENARGYSVTVRDAESNAIVKSQSVPEDATEAKFPMYAGKKYICQVQAVNACGKGSTGTSPEKVCSPKVTPTPTTPPTPSPVCPAPPQKQGVCKWDPLEGANEYNVTVKNVKTGETIKSETIKSPTAEMKFTADPTTEYQCIVVPVGKCSEGPPAESPPTSCVVPSVSPTPTIHVATVPPTVPPTAPPATVPPTVPPTRPPATPTPVVVVRIPPNVLPPGNNPPQQQPPVQQPPVGGGQPPVAQPTQPPVVATAVPLPTATLAPGQPSPVPTIKPTGALSNSLVLVGASIILLIVGSLAFFII